MTLEFACVRFCCCCSLWAFLGFAPGFFPVQLFDVEMLLCARMRAAIAVAERTWGSNMRFKWSSNAIANPIWYRSVLWASMSHQSRPHSNYEPFRWYADCVWFISVVFCCCCNWNCTYLCSQQIIYIISEIVSAPSTEKTNNWKWKKEKKTGERINEKFESFK